MQKAIQELKTNIIHIDSPVGESACNGRVENAVRRVQEKMRTLRRQLERGIGRTIPDNAVIMPWMARWAAELISKYAPGDDGKTRYERIRRERCQVPLAPFGETVMYLPMKTAASSKGRPARRLGVWLGVAERSSRVGDGMTPGEELTCGVCNGWNQQHFMPIDEDSDEKYWTAYAIQCWTRGWFTKHPMKAWSIDNYDGKDSCDELEIELIVRHGTEAAMEPQMFQQLRKHMLATELEMDDTLTTKALTQKEREREWHGLKDLVFNLCNDYLSGALDNNAKVNGNKSRTRFAHNQGTSPLP